jgi:hypothetical protein
MSVLFNLNLLRIIALRKMPKATEYSNHCTAILSARAENIVVRILRIRIEKKIKDILGENRFGFRRRKGMRDATGILKIILERTLVIDKALCACVLEW